MTVWWSKRRHLLPVEGFVPIATNDNIRHTDKFTRNKIFKNGTFIFVSNESIDSSKNVLLKAHRSLYFKREVPRVW